MASMRVDAEREFLDCFDATVAPVYGYTSRLTGDDPAHIERIVRDVYLDVLRRARERSLVEIDVATLLADVRGRLLDAMLAVEPDDGAPRLATAPARPAASGSLTPRERVALTLRFVDEMPASSVAATLDLSVRATDALVAKSRARLRSRAADPDDWLDEMLPARAPSPTFVAALRRQLLVGWGTRSAAPVAQVPERSGGVRHLLLATAVAAGAVGLVFGAVRLADATSRETVASAGPPPTDPVAVPPSTTPVTSSAPIEPRAPVGTPVTVPAVPTTSVPPQPDVTAPVPPPTTDVAPPDAEPDPEPVPAIDLATATLLGVRPSQLRDVDVDVDATVAALAAAVGAPTHDTGWYPSTLRDDAACRDGVERRVVQFGDVTVGFVRDGDGSHRVAAWTIGTDPDQAARHGLADPLPEAARLGIGWNDSTLYFGTLGDIADAGFTIRFLDETGDAIVPDDPTLATRAEVLLDGEPDLGLALYGGIVIGIEATTLPAC